MSDAKIRVLIVEDHEKVRAQIQRIVETMPGITVVGTATNGLSCRPNSSLASYRATSADTAPPNRSKNSRRRTCPCSS